MTANEIDETTRARAKAAWDAAIQDEQEAREIQERLVAARDELEPFLARLTKAHDDLWAAWRDLSAVSRDEIQWGVQNCLGAGNVEPALKALSAALIAVDGTTETIYFNSGRLAMADTGVSTAAIRAVAQELGLRSYGSSQREKPLPDERLLLELCQELDDRVTLVNVRNALKRLPRK